MCGFLGQAGLAQINKTNLINGLAEIEHRGPDETKYQINKNWALGFNRLRILDLSSHGSQPMSNLNKDVIITFNGQIYNFLDLRKDLEASGYVLNGGSDTEVLLNYYNYVNRDIVSLLNKCNGMFAFSIIDTSKKKLFIARDRLGVKPLFYSKTKNSIFFSSEIKALKKILPNLPTLSKEAVLAYLKLGFVPGWLSIYDEIKSLKPGSYGVYDFETGSLKISKYWKPKSKENLQNKSLNEYKIIANEILEDATKIRLNSDVPISLFLSGGIDSGLVASKISSIGSSSDIFANTIRFPDWKNDESKLAQETADFLGIKLLIHDAKPLDSQQLFDIIGHFDEPFADQSALVTSLVSSEASKNSTVILTGDGGDESFGGYREYKYSKILNYLSLFPDSFLKILGFSLSKKKDEFISRLGSRLRMTESARSGWTHIYPCDETLENILSAKWIHERSFNVEKIVSEFQLKNIDDALAKAQTVDLNVYLPDNVLKKVDMMSMKHSIEVRSPLLDYRLVELGLSLPHKFKINKGVTKYFLRSLAQDMLPKNITSAPKKGFGIPLKNYLFTDGVLNSQIKVRLARLSSSEIFNGDLLMKFINSSKANPLYLYRLLCLQIWYEKNDLA